MLHKLPSAEREIIKSKFVIQVPGSHDYNPSYSGGRDQEDPSSNPAWANSSQDLISKRPITKIKAGRVAQGVGPKFKPQYCKKINK
jgi:hypothetical protein